MNRNIGNTVQLRPLDLLDIKGVVQLWFNTWHTNYPDFRHPHTIEQWEDRFRTEVMRDCEIWVAEMDNTIVGFAAVKAHQFFLSQLYVSPEHQNMGIGRMLLIKAKELSPNGLRLHTLQVNKLGRIFYERNGFIAGAMGINMISGHPNIMYEWIPES